MRRYSLTVRRWLALGLATCGVTAAVAVPLLTSSPGHQKPSPGQGLANLSTRLFCKFHPGLC
jgi:hypothetical protein